MSQDTKIRTINYVAGVDEFMDQIQAMTNEFGSHGDAELFAAYLRRQHRKWRINVERLADKLNCPEVYLQLLFDAKVPAAKIDRYFLETVADVFKEDPATIFSLVGRPFYSEDNREEMISAKQQLSEYILNEVNTVLFATIDERYADDTNNTEVYDQVIGELQRIIARQRRDLRFIEGLMTSLENPNLTQVLSKDLGKISAEPDQQTIIYLKENLERIVKHFGGDSSSETKDIG